jgi:peptide/nickel transport system permease protein
VLNFILRRLLLLIPTTFGVALVVFTIYHAAPGDPATVMMGLGSGGNMAQGSDTAARADKFKRDYGLDRSVAVQFLNYIGPFNLLRDGHPWFSSPYGERKVEREVVGGRELALGVPLDIGHLRGLSAEERERLDAAAASIANDDPDREASLRLLRERGDAALPPLLTALHARMRAMGESGEREFASLDAALATLIGLTPVRAENQAEPRVTRARQWFGWYYADGGGDRVRNSGAKKWGGLLALDLGREMQMKTPVVEELARRLKVTVPLSLTAVLLSYMIALPLGIFSVRRQGTRLDGAATVGLFVLYSIPTFWAGLMLILMFGKTGLDLLPVLGLHDKDAASFSTGRWLWDLFLHVIMPIATMTYGSFAYLSRQMRAGMLEVIRQDYIRTARAKGLSENVVIYKHALRNSVIPVITLLASILPVLIGGSIIVETVFDIPGMGRYAFDGLIRRDFYIVMATTIFVGVMTQIGILLSDVTYALVDPRIRHS